MRFEMCIHPLIKGLGKGAVSLGNIYGIGSGSPTKSKKSQQQQLEPFPDGVTRSQFYYLVINDNS